MKKSIQIKFGSTNISFTDWSDVLIYSNKQITKVNHRPFINDMKKQKIQIDKIYPSVDAMLKDMDV